MISIQNRTVWNEIFKRITGTQRVGTVPELAGREQLTYGVLIDERELDHMARKAAKNRSGQHTAGPVTVKIHHRQPEPTEAETRKWAKLQ